MCWLQCMGPLVGIIWTSPEDNARGQSCGVLYAVHTLNWPHTADTLSPAMSTTNTCASPSLGIVCWASLGCVLHAVPALEWPCTPQPENRVSLPQMPHASMCPHQPSVPHAVPRMLGPGLYTIYSTLGQGQTNRVDPVHRPSL